uniref:Uncharacterized protein n=1 Tax=Anopheles funestus TaxID=62324 RepID=A0A182S0G4_ANOFN
MVHSLSLNIWQSSTYEHKGVPFVREQSVISSSGSSPFFKPLAIVNVCAIKKTPSTILSAGQLLSIQYCKARSSVIFLSSFISKVALAIGVELYSLFIGFRSPMPMT